MFVVVDVDCSVVATVVMANDPTLAVSGGGFLMIFN
jgi:hypothetical protein